MNLYLISFDLKAPGRNYQPVYDYIATFGDTIKPLQTVYLVKTYKTATQVRNDLNAIVDNNDQVLVITISTTAWATYNLPNTTNWLHAH